MPPWSSNLRHLYWHLRANRCWNTAARRKFYRRIAAEKKRLHEEGVDSEEIRLLCRWLSNLDNRKAEYRYLAHVAQMQLPL